VETIVDPVSKLGRQKEEWKWLARIGSGGELSLGHGWRRMFVTVAVVELWLHQIKSRCDPVEYLGPPHRFFRLTGTLLPCAVLARTSAGGKPSQVKLRGQLGLAYEIKGRIGLGQGLT